MKEVLSLTFVILLLRCGVNSNMQEMETNAPLHLYSTEEDVQQFVGEASGKNGAWLYD